MNKKITNMLYSGLMLAAASFPMTFQYGETEAATYESNTNTDVGILDYIENRRRAERENILLPEQLQLLKDAHRMREELRNPLDPSKNVPIALEGDDMFYNQITGDVEVNGNVQLTTLDAKRLNTDSLKGNIDDTSIEIEGKAKMLQLTPDQLRIVLTGYKTQYNYNRSLGKMEDITGKAGNKYIKGNRVEFYPDLIVIYNGSATKCSAKHPDYRLQADRIEIYPDGRMISYGVKYYLGDMVVYQSSKEITDPNSGNMPHMPKAGYSSDNGVWVKDDFNYHIADRVSADFSLKYMSKKSWKGDGGINWYTKNAGTFKIYQGHFEDSRNRWIRKGPTLDYVYQRRIGQTPFHWRWEYERGNWHQDNTHSIHTLYKVELSTDAVKLGTWRLHPSVNYSITTESLNDTKVTGTGYTLLFTREFDKKWATFARYEYSQVNSKNGVFNFDVDSYSKKFGAGVSYRMTNNDRFVAGYKWDATTKKLQDIDWYWFHDMHCAEFILRYQPRERKYNVSLQFLPW